MNKELFSYLSITIALLVGALYYSNTIQSPIISLLNNIKIKYHNTTSYIGNTIDRHFYQAQEIKTLKLELKQYEKNHIVMQELAGEIHDIYEMKNSKLHSNPQIELVRTISYEKFGNFNRVWMDIPDYNSSKIYGLTYKEYVAGIVINKNAKPLALLNKDLKSAYAVTVGAQNAPGIAHGNNGDELVVNFIPAWFTITVGDEVVTSGLDDTFIKGLKVGKIISVSSAQGYQTALISPYYKSNEPSFFYMIRSVR
jgi:rod shape-determining protein MreC